MQPIEKVFTPAKIVRFTPEVAEIWQEEDIAFRSNGVPWIGNGYLLIVDDQLDDFKEVCEEEDIEWEKYASYQGGYTTTTFGFRDHGAVGEEIEIWADLLDEMEIEWCGFYDVSFFTIAATKEQIAELYERLQEPIKEFREENGIGSK